MKPVILSAMSMVNAIGNDWRRVLHTVTSGAESSLRKSVWGPERKVCWIGEVQDRSVSCSDDPDAPPLDPADPFDSRNSRILRIALRALEPQLRRAIESYGAHRIGVVMGSSTSGIREAEEMYPIWRGSGMHPAGYRYSRQEMGSVSEFVARETGLDGPRYTVSTACSSSAKVFRSARSLIRMGWCDAVLVGGGDSLCGMTLGGFGSLGLLSPEPCNPFSANRSGISIGEGAALFLMEAESAERTGVALLGVGESSDAYHMSAPDPDGAGASRAMAAALEDASLSPSDIRYLNLHGTGTIQNDAMESAAVASIFPSGVPCSSTKGYVGHLLGASGAVEIALLWAMLTDGDSAMRCPVHRWDGARDPALPVIDLVSAPREVTCGGSCAIMSSSFGFGGSNCAVVLGKI